MSLGAVVGGEGAMGRAFKATMGAWNVIVAVVDLVFLQGFTPIQEMAKWGRPSPAVCACAVTSQSYSPPSHPNSFLKPCLALPSALKCFPHAWYHFVTVICFTVVCLVQRCSLSVDNRLYFPFLLDILLASNKSF